MNAVLVLLTLSALIGLILGPYFRWGAIVMSSVVLAFVAAVALQNEGFGLFAGISIIIGCLAVHQMAYLIGAALTADDLSDE